MFLFSHIWHLIFRTVGALVFNPPSLPAWAWITLTVMRTVVVLVLFRRNIAPFLLAKVTRHIRARSISPLSIRGLYFRSSGRTWRVQRISWSFHPWAESRLSVNIEGLRLDFAKPETLARHKRMGPQRSPMPESLASFAALQEAVLWFFHQISKSSPFKRVRTKVSSVFIIVARIFIRCLPSLTQNLDFELDSAVISFAALSGATFIISGVTLYTKVDFSQLEKELDALDPDTRKAGVESRHPTSQPWNSFLRGGADRFWERLWGQMVGHASVSIAISEMLGCTGPVSPILPSRHDWIPASNGSSHSVNVQPPGHFELSPDIFLRVASPLLFKASLQFSPKLLTLQHHSLESSLEVPDLDVSADGVRWLLDAFKSQENGSKGILTPLTVPEPRSSFATFSPPASPVPVSPTSPTSPFMSAFSQITQNVRRGSVSSSPVPRVQRLKQTNTPPFATVFKAIKLRLPSINVARSLEMNTKELGRVTYMAALRGLAIDLEPSDPHRSALHRKWLGSSDYSRLDGFSYGFSCKFDLATLDRLTSDGIGRPFRLFTLRGLNIDLLLTHWPQPWIVIPPFISGDPNTGFVACDVSVLGFDMTERLEELCAIVKHATSGHGPPLPHPPVPASLISVPRIELRAVCGDIRARLMCVNEVSQDITSILDVHTAGLNVGLSTAFRTAYGKTRCVDDEIHPNSHVQMDSSFHILFQPTFVRASLVHDSENSDDEGGWIPSMSSFSTETVQDEPLLGLDAVELTVASQTLGHLGSAEGAVPQLELHTTIVDVRCITDGISIDLWKMDCIDALRIVLNTYKMRAVTTEDRPQVNTLFRFYTGVSVHFAIGCLTGIATGADINPACDLELSRGLAVRSGLSLQYCCMSGSRQCGLVQERFAAARDRLQLGLPEDLLIQLMAVVNADADSDDVSALLKGTLWQTTCRTAISTRYTADNEHDATSYMEGSGCFISIPRTVTKVCVRYRNSGVHATEVTSEETCEVSVDISHLQSRLNLLNAYSALLAMHTLQPLIERPRLDGGSAQTRWNTRTTLRLRVENAHIICQFPLREKLFVRVLSASLELKPLVDAKVECRSIVAWVPSAQVEQSWEELLRIRDASITLTGTSPGDRLTLAANGLRISIPHRYVLSDLVLDIGVMFKALRHLLRTVKLGRFVALHPPTAESPKHLPSIDVHIHSVTIEAADSPFEAKLGLIWRTGFQAQKVRIERELAFEAKLRAILASGDSEVFSDSTSQSGVQYHFTAKRTTSVADARHRLNMVHSDSWLRSILHRKEAIARKEDSIVGELRPATHRVGLYVPIPIVVHTPEKAPPLFRAVITGLSVSITRPMLHDGHQAYLTDLGGMPSSTEYSLLLPMHLQLSLEAAKITLRDYDLPIFNVISNTNGPSLAFATNLVIAEEMGCARSVEWLQCLVVPENTGIPGARPFQIDVPKTIMPVKSYANPDIHFCTTEVTDFTWGVSYNPAIQEVMRIIETLSHPPRDPSPAIGFWDKLRLVFHWRINAVFKGGAQLHFKGSRDPYHIVGVGAGFDFRWDGNVSIQVGYRNNENELIQLISDSMVIAIPCHRNLQDGIVNSDTLEPDTQRGSHPSTLQDGNDRKVCAKFSNGIRWGVGISLERTCGAECHTCRGDDFSRQCRFFSFIPHHEVVLRSVDNHENDEAQDSYAGFRSNFIHFSTSLTSPLTQGKDRKENSFHLTPRTFAHFWSWWHLFDSALSLPIRQGNLFPESRPPSKKFGRHLVTIKYRISFSPLYITHVYKIDNGDAWSAGESHCVGVKAFIQRFQADMHQREEETSKSRPGGVGPKVIRHKPFSAAEVVITGLDLRALFSVFAEPQKKTIPLKDPLAGGIKFWDSLIATPLSSSWLDMDDFVELDWSPAHGEPNLYLHEAVYCPRFVYFKRTPRAAPLDKGNGASWPKTKFGDEDSHVCLMGKEPTAHEVQLEFCVARLTQLRAQLADSLRTNESGNIEYLKSLNTSSAARETSLTQMVALLERYTDHLSQLRSAPSDAGDGRYSTRDDFYDMPADIKLPQELGDFGNVYQIHCPKISLNNTTRNILQQYYLASRARRGFEYHMSARAVKFIRDQALATGASLQQEQSPEKRQRATQAAQVVRRILTGEERHKPGDLRRREPQRSNRLTSADPLYGWVEGVVSERKAHLCLLLKPQIVLRSDNDTQSVVVLAADHVVLRNYGILDIFNAEDPVSGYVMQKNYADINSLQVFRPVDGSSTDHLPLEVFIDYRCESRDFDRLVPQTNATLRYDKFNRLRLRNNVTTIAVSSRGSDMDMIDHLLHETDLIVIQVPRFSVSADAAAFGSIADVVTNLLLFSDPVHKARMTQLETMLFSYDFTDLASAAKVVADLQARIRQLIRLEGGYALNAFNLDAVGQQDMLASKAHILTLSQELNLIFDAIKLAQDKADDRNQDNKSALRLQASSSEISWQMVDDNRELLAKLAVRGIDYSWLSRQDSSTANRMDIGDLQAFDGSPTALWPEILAKHSEPATHHMVRRGLFAAAHWSVLAPVGGIAIYDHFEVELHPIRLALETHLGNKLLDYLVPGRRSRREANRSELVADHEEHGVVPKPKANPTSAFSGDPVHSAPQLTVHPPSDSELAPSLSGSSTSRPLVMRKVRPIMVSRSFSNLRSAATEYHAPGIPKSSSSTALAHRRESFESDDTGILPQNGNKGFKKKGDASEMRQRSTQKIFIYVKIPSVHVLLSVMKGRAFLLRDARLRTHELEWRNRTWSFEELINQFIPSDPSWRGWAKVVWQQPVIGLGGVVKELVMKSQVVRIGRHRLGLGDGSGRTLTRFTRTSPERSSIRPRTGEFPKGSEDASSAGSELTRSRQRSTSNPVQAPFSPQD